MSLFTCAVRIRLMSSYKRPFTSVGRRLYAPQRFDPRIRDKMERLSDRFEQFPRKLEDKERLWRINSTIMWTFIGGCVGVTVAWHVSKPNRVGLQSGTTRDRSREVGIMGFSKDLLPRVWSFLNQNFLLRPDDLEQKKYWTLLTSAVSHVEWWHLAANMITFHAFSTVTMQFSPTPWRFAALIGSSAVAGNASWIWNEQQHPDSRYGQQGKRALGASGVVMGVGVAAAALRPWSRLFVMGIVPAPLIVLVPAYIGIDYLYLNNASSSVGHSAHLGGAFAGGLFYTIFLRRYGAILRLRPGS